MDRKDRNVYFFGTVGEGHFLYDRYGQRVSYRSDEFKKVPWGYEIDGRLVPKGDGRHRADEGVAKGHWKDGWTAIAWNDYSVDTRPGSNAAFLIDETVPFSELLVLGLRAFPWFNARIGYVISVYEPTELSEAFAQRHR